MGLLNIAFLAAFLVLTVAASVVVARMMQYRESKFLNPPKDGEGLDLSRYAVMGRLLDPAEAAFLAQQPGMTARKIREFRSARRTIFRGYLRELSADYQTLHAEARQIVAASPDKNPELVGMLVRQQITFWSAIARLEAELVLDAVGVSHVDPRRLLEAVEALNAAVARAASIPGPIPVG